MAKIITRSLALTLVFLHAASLVMSQGTQFITGPCASDADCASSCCGFNSGKCAGPVIAQERDGGCGFGDAQPNDNAAKAFFAGEEGAGAEGEGEAIGGTANATAATDVGGTTANVTEPDNAAAVAVPTVVATSGTDTGSSSSSGKPPGTQFITGPCGNDTDCASGCCGFNSGTCAGAIVAQERDGGCGFGDARPNDNAAQALRGAGKRAFEYMA